MRIYLIAKVVVPAKAGMTNQSLGDYLIFIPQNLIGTVLATNLRKLTRKRA